MMNGAILIVPMPVASSNPRTVVYRPLFLAMWPAPVGSWKKTLGATRYSSYSDGLMLPVRFPWKLTRSATIADTSGEDRLVPPMPNQPGTGWAPLNVAQTLFGVASLPVQYSAYGVNSSALAEMSGASRHGVPILASEHWVVPLPKVVLELITPGPFWYRGIPQYWLDPPPVAPVAAHQKKPPLLSLAGPGAASLQRFCTFHTASPTRG